ncbi:ABC transporter substrate-binding protein [Cohnella thailandensis]|uniref:ABC transporter substrate-binding protein n=1 Tax=Cohnella thailandensis TaxID=557557 RepID=A0A841SS85_9BACL|nr:ABC transporter substrate-binding protein [Cohnella thailandensis]MBB6632925.1 ABC transporter substrate-binding protein [Cohnella thailandensis]MBP1975382.1 putative aldouronate transport system substrate-binding protein [Cohnella thailandensis]
MKQTKRKAALLLALLTISSLSLAACGGNNDDKGTSKPENKGTESAKPSASESASTGSAEGSPASDLKPYKLKLVYEGAPQADETLVEEALNKILTEKINATIDIAPIDWGAWDDKMNLMIASREPVDVLFTASWNGYAKNVAKGAYMDLGPLLDQYGQGIKESLDPAFLDGSKIGGKNYAIPTNKELASAGGIVYRKDIADELGIDMSQVKKIEDLDAVYKVVKEKKPGMTALYNGGFTSHFFVELDFLGDATIPGAIDKNGTDAVVKPAEEFPQYLNALKVTRDYFQKGYINKDAATTQTSSLDAYKTGNVFSTVEPLKPGKAEEIASATGLEGKLAQIQLTGKTVATSETTGAMLAISSTSEDPARAMMLINLLHTDKEIVNLLNFGIEGTHYTLSGNVMTPTEKSAQYAPGVAWELGNQFLNYTWNTEAADKWDQFKQFNEGALSSPALGFTFDSEPVKTEVGALANVLREYQKALETGSIDPDSVLPKFKAAEKSAGLDKVIAEKQKQLDEFLASKK